MRNSDAQIITFKYTLKSKHTCGNNLLMPSELYGLIQRRVLFGVRVNAIASYRYRQSFVDRNLQAFNRLPLL